MERSESHHLAARTAVGFAARGNCSMHCSIEGIHALVYSPYESHAPFLGKIKISANLFTYFLPFQLL
ncbi:hypothetical protein CJD38_14595 [Stenotrophobium rhamnosiphilum]|uniref:Uncharacterized protein n=1 Tax=Stenotrophobium rhamnosiphilum TaxID=2029166 RepID=A0A2T5MDR1_9GAMM|nr:hypothetical protein CJD38_14595 [Stenotrophobium rhamnosiphilum]